MDLRHGDPGNSEGGLAGGEVAREGGLDPPPLPIMDVGIAASMDEAGEFRINKREWLSLFWNKEANNKNLTLTTIHNQL